MKTREPSVFRSAPSIIKPSVVFGCLVMLLPASLSAVTTFTTSFDTDGDTEGFSGVNTSALTVAGGLLSGTATSGDPRLQNITTTSTSTPLYSKSVEETWGTISFRVRETDNSGETPVVVSPFDGQGLNIVLNSTNNGANNPTRLIISSGAMSAVDSGEGFFTITTDFSSWAENEIRYFRFDPIGANPGGSLFEVDFVEVTSIPEPSAALLGALGVLGLVRRRR